MAVAPRRAGVADPVLSLSQISIAPDSRGVSLVEREHATEPFASADTANGRDGIGGGEGDDVAQALVVALGVVVLHKVAEHGAQMTFAEGDNVPEALVLDGPNEPLGVGVQVRAPRREAQQLHAGNVQQGPEVRRIEGSRSTLKCPKPVRGPAAASVRLRATCAIQVPSAWEVTPAM